MTHPIVAVDNHTGTRLRVERRSPSGKTHEHCYPVHNHWAWQFLNLLDRVVYERKARALLYPTWWGVYPPYGGDRISL